MRKSRLILSVVFISVIDQIAVLAQDRSKLSIQPYLSIEKSFSGSKLEFGYEWKNVDFKPVDIASAGATLKFSKFTASAALAAPWANGGDMDFSPYLDLSGGLDFSHFTVYGGRISSVDNTDDHSKYDLINPFYIGVQGRYDMGIMLFVDDFQFGWGEEENNFDYSGFANTLKAYVKHKYLMPYFFATLELWRGINDDKNGFFDNTSFNIGLGLLLGKSTARKCNAMRSVGSLVTVRKPNIYIYPVEPCSVSVMIRPQGEMLTSIPEYGDGWNVFAYPDGWIPGTDGFLFYEASVKIDTPSEGWCMNRDEIKPFFNDILSQYGFNKREISDFVEYWEKILVDAPYYSIYPVLNEAVDRVCPLAVEPEPDHILRLWFVIKSAEKFIDLPKPIIPSFSRNGFVVTEWGGILINK